MPYKDIEKRRASCRLYAQVHKAQKKVYDKQRHLANQEQANEYYRRRKKENPQWGREANWRRQGIKITYPLFLQMLEDQCYTCALCERKLTLSAHVDHDHITGIVRGLLCRACNARIAWRENYKEQIDQYLAGTPGSPAVERKSRA